MKHNSKPARITRQRLTGPTRDLTCPQYLDIMGDVISYRNRPGTDGKEVTREGKRYFRD